MDRAAAGGCELRRCELADLVVREAKVRRRAGRMLDEQARRDGRRQRLRRAPPAALPALTEMQLDRAQILEAEAPPQDRRVREILLGVIRQPGGAALDQRSHRRRQQAIGVSRERPHAVDLLDEAGVPIRAGQLLDDERNALGLRVHRRGAPEVTFPEHLRDKLGRLELCEALEPERRTRPIRSMSATSVTASLTTASSSGRVASARKTGMSASVRTM